MPYLTIKSAAGELLERGFLLLAKKWNGCVPKSEAAANKINPLNLLLQSESPYYMHAANKTELNSLTGVNNKNTLNVQRLRLI